MTEKSQEMLNESISSLVDGENSELELARILKAAEGADANSSVYDKWQRYHLSGEILRGDVKSSASNIAVPTSFTSSVLAAIESEETVMSSNSSSQSWTHKLGKVAIAASVSLAVLVGFQYVGNNPSIGSPSTLVNTDVAPVTSDVLPGARVPEGFELPSITARTVGNIDDSYSVNRLPPSLSAGNLPSQFSPATSFAPGSEEEQELRARLKRMMLKHADASSTSGSLGAYPYTRVSDSSLNEHVDTDNPTVER